MEFKQLCARALEIRKKYAEIEKQQYGREWSSEELMLGFMKDVGDLAKLVQAHEGVRRVDNLDEALGHELSDCLWSVIVLANKLGVDLEKAFTKTMDELEQRQN
jgi:NTP pyrophosphatase (non-canonical NTP hydrolase)